MSDDGGAVWGLPGDETSLYRLLLWRDLRLPLQRPRREPFQEQTGRRCLFIMLNPSTATDTADDPTIRRCIGYAQGWGYDILEVANLFSYRATMPDELYRIQDPVGPGNDLHILKAAERAEVIVCAWGAHGAKDDRGGAVLRMLAGRTTPAPLTCLGFTGSGSGLQPRHPLYLRRNLPLLNLETRSGGGA